jgi:hypothetical protein
MHGDVTFQPRSLSTQWKSRLTPSSSSSINPERRFHVKICAVFWRLQPYERSNCDRDDPSATETETTRTPHYTTQAQQSSGYAYREDDAPVGDGAPKVRRLGAHRAVQERLERPRHGARREEAAAAGRPAMMSRRRGRGGRRKTGRVGFFLRSCWRAAKEWWDGMGWAWTGHTLGSLLFYRACRRPAALEAIG